MCFTSVSLFLLNIFNLASKSFRMYTKEGIKYFCLWRWENMCIWFGNLCPPPMSQSIVEGWWGRLVLVEMSIRKGRIPFWFFGSWLKVPQMPWSPTSKSKWVGEPDQILSYNKAQGVAGDRWKRRCAWEDRPRKCYWPWQGHQRGDNIQKHNPMLRVHISWHPSSA